MKKVIGTNYFNYPQLRNFAQLEHENFHFIIVKDVFKLFTNIAFRFTQKIYSPLQFLFLPFRKANVQLYHFFNTISFSNKPWLTTFETTLPRLGDTPQFLYAIAVQRLAHPSCKRIIAISACTANSQRVYLEKNFPLLTEKILEKQIVLHPPQSLLIENLSVKRSDGPIVFTMVGSDFFRKGGKEVLEVFDDLLDKGVPLKLYIISSLDYGDYASQSTSEDYQFALQVIEKHRSRIIHYGRLENEKVLEILRESHVGLLPTYADTYGYSVLEAQAAGCPVITTNVRALPEINNNSCGWMIDLPKDSMGNALIATAEERVLVSKIIRNELYNIIISILGNKSQLVIKGELAIERIRKYHDPKLVAEKLRILYDEATA